MFRKICILSIATVLTLLLGSSTYTQQGPNTAGTTIFPVTGDVVDTSKDLAEPYQIARFKVETTAGGIFVSIKDAGLPSYPDWWEATIYKYGTIPYKVMTTPKPTGGFAGRVICYAVGGGAQVWYVDVRYYRGVNVFPAGFWLRIDGPSGTVTVTEVTTAP
ncbi:MAG: hypothetical protein ACETWC_07980 [Acidobacteriota bacterium]